MKRISFLRYKCTIRGIGEGSNNATFQLPIDWRVAGPLRLFIHCPCLWLFIHYSWLFRATISLLLTAHNYLLRAPAVVGRDGTGTVSGRRSVDFGSSGFGFWRHGFGFRDPKLSDSVLGFRFHPRMHNGGLK